MEGERKTLEGEIPLLKDGALSLQTSLTHRELPPYPRHLQSDKLFRFLRVAGIWGKFLDLDGRCFFSECGYRARLVGGESGARNDMRGIALKCGVVGNAPCVVPIREMLLANLFLCERRFIPPHQSPTAPASPQGEAFLQESFLLHDKAISESIYTRPHPSPAATNCLQSSPP